MRDLVN